MMRAKVPGMSNWLIFPRSNESGEYEHDPRANSSPVVHIVGAKNKREALSAAAKVLGGFVSTMGTWQDWELVLFGRDADGEAQQFTAIRCRIGPEGWVQPGTYEVAA